MSKRPVELEYFKNVTCYDLVPMSSKVIMFDARVSIKTALASVSEQNTECNLNYFSGAVPKASFLSAACTNFEEQQLIGILSPSTILELLLSEDLREKLLDKKLNTLFSLEKGFPRTLSPDSSFMKACKMLCKSENWSVPIYTAKTNSVHGFISALDILRAVSENLVRYKKLENVTIEDTLVGKHVEREDEVFCACLTENLRSVLVKLKESKQAAIPILDGENKPICLFSLGEIASEAVLSKILEENFLDLPISEYISKEAEQTGHGINEGKSQDKMYFFEDPIISFNLKEPFDNAVKKFMTHEVHHLVSIDRESGAVTGLLSVKDLVKFCAQVKEK
eukprot:maker-scaffold_30-snap-gene-3.31-mRNA-1 protein AED:0.03 eAED:0.03 QI:67/1/1/1/0.75/0.55/9/163/336